MRDSHTATQLTSFDVYAKGDDAVVVRLGDTINIATHVRVTALTRALDQTPFPGMVEVVPAFTTVTVYYDPLTLGYQEVIERLTRMAGGLVPESLAERRVVRIPVCYGGEFGPDIADVAKHNGVTEDDVVSIHTAGEYMVYMIGFAPGFPYLGGMSEKIATPRLESPRLTIPAGSVGIAGGQTGVYPISTPGGWRLIGRTPLPLFLPDANPPSLLEAGDTVVFYPINESDFRLLSEEGCS